MALIICVHKKAECHACLMNQTLTLHDRSPKKKTRGDTGRNRHKRPVSNETTYLNLVVEVLIATFQVVNDWFRSSKPLFEMLLKALPSESIRVFAIRWKTIHHQNWLKKCVIVKLIKNSDNCNFHQFLNEHFLWLACETLIFFSF